MISLCSRRVQPACNYCLFKLFNFLLLLLLPPLDCTIHSLAIYMK